MSDRDRRRSRVRQMAALMLVALIVAFMVPAGLYFAVFLPVETRYNDILGSHYAMAIKGATFEGIDQQVLAFWSQMNATFGTQNHDTIYDSPFYWDHVPVHSLASVDNYLGQLHTKALNYEEQYASMKKNSGTAQGISDWYNTAVEDLADEVTEGPWAANMSTPTLSDIVHGAYILNLYPNVYTLGWIAWIVFFAGLIVAIAALIVIAYLFW